MHTQFAVYKVQLHVILNLLAGCDRCYFFEADMHSYFVVFDFPGLRKFSKLRQRFELASR
ncbi:hypothetical protein BA177_04425 [Woeseia oceani]|uniref:Uncharacterized protein n=1 Tax=Woeseia oceani TaxID=1548547 RepID=A0A193LDH5_9GAMM|nr:hypothetical protein BA177_04425 [Woeseia oceani]